jgi:methylmalonyl-CoA mutase N-terminal domain/subunit
MIWKKNQTGKNKNLPVKQVTHKVEFTNSSGFKLKRIYAPTDILDLNYEQDLGNPGEYPFTRGVQPTMYRKKLWTMRQYAGFGTAKESNKRYKFLISQGQTGLSVAFDLPTQMGYDSDHQIALGEVGKVGVAIDTLKDLEILFEEIDLEKVSVSMTINASAFVIFAMYLALAKKRNISFEKLNGTIQNDILKEYIARGTYIYPPRPSMRLIIDLFRYSSEKVPNWNIISISGYHIREAGANAVQELAFTIANGIEYVKYAINAGLNIDQFAPRLSFFFNSHNNFFEEIAKFRAARRIWAKLMRKKFKAKNPRSWALRFHTQTGGSTLISQQKDNNIVRVTLQALASVLGGTQSLHTNSRDEALSLPTEDSVKIALRTQQIIAYESGVSDAIDPLGGSYYIETLTNRIEEQVNIYLEKIEKMGGMLFAIENGFIQREIQETAYNYQKAIENGNRIIVGLNKFIEKEKIKNKYIKINKTIEKNQIATLREVKKKRDNKKVKKSLEQIKEASLTSKNLIPPVIDAVECYTSIGEICGTLRQEWGEYEERIIV